MQAAIYNELNLGRKNVSQGQPFELDNLSQAGLTGINLTNLHDQCQPPQSGGGLSGGAIAGAVIGSVAGAGLLGVSVAYCCKRWRRR